jgi:hypothetical protein
MMDNRSDSRDAKNEYLFHHLVAMFQTLALQQMGKLINPITGKLERDLQQGRITIDMLQMIKDKTEGNLMQSEQVILDRALTELQMNYVDEVNRPEESDKEKDRSEEDTEEEYTEEENGKASEEGTV